MNLEEQFKSLKSTLESKKQQQVQLQADINALDSQLADLQQEANALGITDLTQLESIISTKSQQLQTQLTELSNKLGADTQPVSQDTVSTQDTVSQSTEVQDALDLFGDFSL